MVLISTLAWGQDSLNVTKVGEISFWENLYEIAVSGNFAYAMAGNLGVRVIDISDPQNPVEVGWCNTPESVCEIVIDSTFAYIADGPSGLSILDLSNPTNPIRVGFCDTPGMSNDLAVRDNFVYLADGIGGLRIIDASDFSHPIEISNIPYWGYEPGAQSIALSGNCAYICCADCKCGAGGAIYAIDISDPFHP